METKEAEKPKKIKRTPEQRAEINRKAKEWRDMNPEKIREYSKKRRERDPEGMRKYQREYMRKRRAAKKALEAKSEA